MFRGFKTLSPGVLDPGNYPEGADPEKVVNCPQAENFEIYNVLKIPCLVTKDNHKSKYCLLVWHDEILKS